MPRSDTDPLVFQCPDGEARVPTWKFIMNEIGGMCEDITDSVTDTNSSLDRILNRLDDWIAEQ